MRQKGKGRLGEWEPRALGQSCAHLEDGPLFPTALEGALWPSGSPGVPDPAEPLASWSQFFRLEMRQVDPEGGSHSTWHQEGVMEEGGSELGPAGPVATMTATAQESGPLTSPEGLRPALRCCLSQHSCFLS